MGNFYVNMTVYGTDRDAVTLSLKGRNAYVSPTINGSIVIYDEACDDQDPDMISQLSSKLSKELNSPVFAVLNHDDDILRYQLYERGELVDEYDSTPGYFDDAEEFTEPSGGNAEALCRAFHSDNIDEVNSILKKASLDGDGYVFAVERHEDLVKALDLPEFSVGYGFNYLSESDIPEGFTRTE